jgi:hypothetical protein
MNYTPDDDQIKYRYQLDVSNSPIAGRSFEDAGQEFDRWLAAHDTRVAKQALLTWKRMFEGYTLDFSSAMSLYDHVRRLLARDAEFIGDRIEVGISA